MKTKEMICLFKGHIDDVNDEDIPYGFCPRCEKDYNEWRLTLPNLFWRVRYNIMWWFRKNIYWRCPSCKKPVYILGKSIKNNGCDCLPF